jgi:hypothetical protein
VSRATHGLTSLSQPFAYETITRYGGAFQHASARPTSAVSYRNRSCKPYNPGKTTLAGFNILPV